jgi:hypothetical protein
MSFFFNYVFPMLLVYNSNYIQSIISPKINYIQNDELKRDEVTGEWRKLYNKEHRDLYSSPSIIRIITSRKLRWVGHVARMGEKRNAYRLLVGKPDGKRPLGRPRRRWVGNIRMDLGEVG